MSSSLPLPRVVADAFPRTLAVNAMLVVGAAALIGLSAQLSVYLPGNPVPITGQTFAVLIAAASVGLARGVSATILYALAGLAGVPWFAGATSGLAVASFGYILGFVLAAAVVGALAERGWTRRPSLTVAAMVLGNLVIYSIGLPWLHSATGLSWAETVGLGATPFLLGDVLKMALAAGLFSAAWAIINRRGSKGTQA